jgi:hypothetical protein
MSARFINESTAYFVNLEGGIVGRCERIAVCVCSQHHFSFAR